MDVQYLSLAIIQNKLIVLAPCLYILDAVLKFDENTVLLVLDDRIKLSIISIHHSRNTMSQKDIFQRGDIKAEKNRT